MPATRSSTPPTSSVTAIGDVVQSSAWAVMALEQVGAAVTGDEDHFGTRGLVDEAMGRQLQVVTAELTTADPTPGPSTHALPSRSSPSWCPTGTASSTPSGARRPPTRTRWRFARGALVS
jgi:hypothetical protein